MRSRLKNKKKHKSNGRTITLIQHYCKRRKSTGNYKQRTPKVHAAEKLIKSKQTITNDTIHPDATGTPVTIQIGIQCTRGGDETRTKTTSTTN